MTTFTIKLPKTFSFTRAGYEKTIAPDSFPPEILALAVLEGLKSTIGDAASAAASGHYETNRGDDTPDWSALPASDKRTYTIANVSGIAEYGNALMDKRIDTLMAGDWTSRSPAVAGLSADQSEVADYMLAAGMIEAPKGMKRGDKLRAVWEAFEAQPATVQATIRAQIEAKKGLGLKIKL
jgi:hypothetical protein